MNKAEQIGLELIRKFEKDDPQNPLRMQACIWSFANKTQIIVRVYAPDSESTKKLWKNRNNGQVNDFVRNSLKYLGIIKNPENWRYDNGELPGGIQWENEVDENKYYYFSWKVLPHLIDF